MKPSLKLLLTIFVLIFIFININIYGETRLSNIEKKIELQFYYLETEYAEGKYIEGDIKKLGFKEYNFEKLDNRQDVIRRMGTFRSEFYLDESCQKEDLSIYIASNEYPYNVYLNGKKIFKAGQYKKKYTSVIYNAVNILLPNHLLNYKNKKNEIAIQIFPKSEEKAISKVILTSYSSNSKSVFLRNFTNINLIQGVFIIGIILFLYFLFLFMFEGFKEIKYLYFSISCLFFSLNYYNITFFYDSINEILSEKISRATYPLSVMFVTLFIFEYIKLFKNKIKLKIISYIFIILPNLLISIIVFLFKNTKADINSFFNGFGIYFVLLGILTCNILLIYSVIKEKKIGTFGILFGFILVDIAIIKDSLNIINNTTPYIWFIPMGFISVVICIFFMLSLEQSKIQAKAVIQSKELTQKNNALNIMMQNIILVSNNLINSSNKLEENITNTLSVIKKYSEDNKTILDKIMNQFGYIEIMINQISVRIENSSQRIPKAISAQTKNVEDVNSILTLMNSHLEATTMSAIEAGNVANQLASIADESTKLINKSKDSIDQISQHSKFINELLSTIEEFTEKTNLLSINASIEAANSGKVGKGFSVIAHEIRNLAIKSQTNLVASFENINNMHEIIENGINLSDEVSERLFKIIEETKRSALKTNNIAELIQDQKEQSSNILKSAESLLIETDNINELSQEDQGENEKIKTTLSELQTTFSSITELLTDQKTKEKELFSRIDEIKNVMEENLKNVDILNNSLK